MIRMSAVCTAFIVILLVLVMGACLGETAIPFDVVMKTLSNKLMNGGHPVDLIDEGIIWNYRLSRAVVAACCGTALALSGVILQALLRNALADPYILGISAGASTGAVSVILLGLGGGFFSMSFGAFAGAILAFGLVFILASRAGGGTGTIILAGVAVCQLFNALTSFIVAKSASAEQAKGVMFWLLGSLSGVRWPDAALAVPVTVAGFIIALWHARALDAFLFGADSAASMGISVKRTYILLISVSAFMTAVMVSIVGSIGFVGLVIPHAARLIVGSRHRVLLPLSAMIGAVFLVAADIIARVIILGQVLPIGVITALVGAPAFALILCGKRRTS